MKKGLLTTTALVAAMAAGSAYAGDVELGVGGYITTGVGVGPENSVYGTDPDKDFHTIFDGEVHFKGVGTLDNGIQIVTRIELEAHSQTDQIDEQWVQIKSQFGTVMIGGNDDAAYNISQSGKQDVGICAGPVDPCYNFTPAYIGTIGGTDSLGIHYYTPKIAGFEAGISWQPSLSDTALPQDTAETTDNSRDRLSIGAAYSNTFGDVSFGIDGGYIHTNASSGGTIDETEYRIGGNIGFSGFGIQAGYERTEDLGHTAGTDVDTFGGGVSYATGPWTFAAAAAYSETDASGTASDAERTVVSVGAKYELGAGVNLAGVVQYGNEDLNAGTSGEDEDGFGGALLLGVAF